MMFAVYICAMIRCVLALHTLIFVGKNNEEKEKELEKMRNKVPEKIVKEIVVEKPVEVRVEVPKYVPGPEKIV